MNKPLKLQKIVVFMSFVTVVSLVIHFLNRFPIDLKHSSQNSVPSPVPSISSEIHEKKLGNGKTLITNEIFSIETPDTAVFTSYKTDDSKGEKLKFDILDLGTSKTEELDNGYDIIFTVLAKPTKKGLADYMVVAKKENKFFGDPIKNSVFTKVAGYDAIYYPVYAQYDPWDKYIVILDNERVLQIEVAANGTNRDKFLVTTGQILNSLKIVR